MQMRRLCFGRSPLFLAATVSAAIQPGVDDDAHWGVIAVLQIQFQGTDQNDRA
jgi:hypothetical protein